MLVKAISSPLNLCSITTVKVQADCWYDVRADFEKLTKIISKFGGYVASAQEYPSRTNLRAAMGALTSIVTRYARVLQQKVVAAITVKITNDIGLGIYLTCSVACLGNFIIDDPPRTIPKLDWCINGLSLLVFGTTYAIIRDTLMISLIQDIILTKAAIDTELSALIFDRRALLRRTLRRQGWFSCIGYDKFWKKFSKYFIYRVALFLCRET
ncbi:hypothetical protein DS901_09085 [Loktanella sp. D2R18]|nr:hypothetical protein DS901_09085 [Loktanella sp. D2R18]